MPIEEISDADAAAAALQSTRCCDEMEQRPNWLPDDVKSMTSSGYMSAMRNDPSFTALMRRFDPYPFPTASAGVDQGGALNARLQPIIFSDGDAQ